MVVAVSFQERYWYPDDGGEVWVSGYYPIDASGRFLSRDALPEGLLICHVAGVTHRPAALTSDEASPGSALILRPEPANAFDPHAVEVVLPSGATVGYVPREIAPTVDAEWSAVVLRERRDSPRDPRSGLTMFLAHADAIVLRVP